MNNGNKHQPERQGVGGERHFRSEFNVTNATTSVLRSMGNDGGDEELLVFR